MQLTIDGKTVEAQKGQSLRELVCQLGLDCGELSRRPLAARIAGEVFTLNYIPLRDQDGEGDRPSMRRAMAASGGNIRLLRIKDSAGRDVYIRTGQFVVFLALRQLWPEAVSTMDCTLGSSVFISVNGAKDFSVSKLKAQVESIVAQDIPLLRHRAKKEEAIARFAAEGQPDKARLLQWRSLEYCSEYSYGDYTDNF